MSIQFCKFVQCVALVLLIGAAHAQTYPKGPVKLIVPFPAGGAVDTAGRLLAIPLSKNVGGPFVVENRGVRTAT